MVKKSASAMRSTLFMPLRQFAATRPMRGVQVLLVALLGLARPLSMPQTQHPQVSATANTAAVIELAVAVEAGTIVCDDARKCSDASEPMLDNVADGRDVLGSRFFSDFSNGAAGIPRDTSLSATRQATYEVFRPPIV